MHTELWRGILKERDKTGRPRSIWEDNIKMGVDTINLTEDWDKWRTLVNTALQVRVA
jgi:hypothetical protein